MTRHVAIIDAKKDFSVKSILNLCKFTHYYGTFAAIANAITQLLPLRRRIRDTFDVIYDRRTHFLQLAVVSHTFFAHCMIFF